MCIEYLDILKIPYIRNNSFAGKITRGDGSQGYIKNNTYPGSPDLIIFLKKGRTLHVEVKSDTGKQSSEQVYYEIKMGVLGHEYYIVRDLKELEKLLK